MAEEFRFEKLSGRAAQFTATMREPERLLEGERARRNFLAPAGFAGNQNRGTAVRDQIDNLDYFTHRTAGTKQQVA